MFVGHLALAFAAKPRTPAVSLGWLIAAVTALDLLWPLLLIAGVEHVEIRPGATAFTPLVFTAYPWSHSLLMAIAWGVALAALARICRVPRSAGVWLAALVVSHWVLDWVTHAPDMPLWPSVSSPRLGLGLWNSIPATIVIEGALWMAGLAIYLRHRRATSWIGPTALWSFVAVSTILWVTGPWSPPPPTPGALAWFALIGWIVWPWAALADRHFALETRS
jgi:membrane-bound metal-dependent hydrolase YbcI (DUF457 family)